MPRSSERDDTTGRRGGCGGTAGSGELGRGEPAGVGGAGGEHGWAIMMAGRVWRLQGRRWC
eukprot:7391693-Prymnesium_polylepis.3